MVSCTNELEKICDWVWRQTLAIHKLAPETRIASSLSPIEIFVSLYYGKVLDFYPKEPLSDQRDRFIISKGHGSISMYPILADLGFFKKEELSRVCKKGSFLGGIPDPIIPGYETVNGSLGHGLGVASGVAIGLKARGKSESVFVLCGDGELHEGACWEAIMLASHKGLDNLNLIVDNNKICMLDHTENIVSLGNLKARLEAFGWHAKEIDGHNVTAVLEALNEMKTQNRRKPKALICNTVKARGLPGLENQPLCHVMNPEQSLLSELLEGKNDE